jgi:hypothetical protein
MLAYRRAAPGAGPEFLRDCERLLIKLRPAFGACLISALRLY